MDSSLIYIILAVVLGGVQLAISADKKKKAKMRQQSPVQKPGTPVETAGLPSWLAGILDEAEKPGENFWDIQEEEEVTAHQLDEARVEGMAAGLPEEGLSAMSLAQLTPVATSPSETPSIAELLERSQKEADAIVAESGEEFSCLEDFSIEKAILYSEVLKPSWKD